MKRGTSRSVRDHCENQTSHDLYYRVLAMTSEALLLEYKAAKDQKSRNSNPSM